MDSGERSCVRKVGREWQIVATVQLEALKAIAVFKASVQPHDTSPSREYLLSMLERNETKPTERNGKRCFNKIVHAVAVSFLWFFSETEWYCIERYWKHFFDAYCI